MKEGTALAAILALVAGLAGSAQAAVMGRFGERVGSLEALAFSLLLSTLLAVAALLVARRSLAGLGEAAAAPRWLWVGALLGAFVVFTITLVSPRLGTTATIGLLVAGQLAAGALIDRFGLFGFEKVPLGATRLAGIALLALGAGLLLKR